MDLAKMPILKVRVLHREKTTRLIFLTTAAGTGFVSTNLDHRVTFEKEAR